MAQEQNMKKIQSLQTHKIEVITTTGKTIITAEIHGVSQKEAIQKAQKVLRKQGQALATSTQDYTPGKSTGGRYTNEQLKKQGWIITQHQPDDEVTFYFLFYVAVYLF